MLQRLKRGDNLPNCVMRRRAGPDGYASYAAAIRARLRGGESVEQVMARYPKQAAYVRAMASHLRSDGVIVASARSADSLKAVRDAYADALKAGVTVDDLIGQNPGKAQTIQRIATALRRDGVPVPYRSGARRKFAGVSVNLSGPTARRLTVMANERGLALTVLAARLLDILGAEPVLLANILDDG